MVRESISAKTVKRHLTLLTTGKISSVIDPAREKLLSMGVPALPHLKRISASGSDMNGALAHVIGSQIVFNAMREFNDAQEPQRKKILGTFVKHKQAAVPLLKDFSRKSGRVGVNAKNVLLLLQKAS